MAYNSVQWSHFQAFHFQAFQLREAERLVLRTFQVDAFKQENKLPNPVLSSEDLGCIEAKVCP